MHLLKIHLTLIILFSTLFLFCTQSDKSIYFVNDKLNNVQNLRILILGNSITGAPPIDRDWTEGWGLAAGSPQNDYVHLLYEKITERINYSPYLKTYGFGDFERNFDSYDLSKLRFIDTLKPDLIILRIGDNINGTVVIKNHLWNYFNNLLLYLQSQSKVVICTSRWYPDKTVDAIMKSCCLANKISFIDISNLYNDKANQASSERTYSQPGWGTHPGDLGMKKIADIIWVTLSCYLK